MVSSLLSSKKPCPPLFEWGPYSKFSSGMPISYVFIILFFSLHFFSYFPSLFPSVIPTVLCLWIFSLAESYLLLNPLGKILISMLTMPILFLQVVRRHFNSSLIEQAFQGPTFLYSISFISCQSHTKTHVSCAWQGIQTSLFLPS